MIRQVEAEVMAESGVGLEDLINPSKVINLTRDLKELSIKISLASSDADREKFQTTYNKKQQTLSIEKRAVMRGWLKNLFVGQSLLAFIASYAMVYDIVPGTALPLSIRVLGFWMWWLFIIPSMRARKPSNAEKEALNIAFLGSPVVSIVLPSFTRDVALIWQANLLVFILCYVYAFLKPSNGEEDTDVGGNIPVVLKKVLTALDYGSGQERGLRK